MNLEIEGKLIVILPEQSGTGQRGKWIKQDFVIETSEQFPKKVCFSAWGDKTDALKQIQKGDHLTVNFNPESREYNGRWYTELRAWKIIKSAQGTSDGNIPPILEEDYIRPPDEEDLPF